MVGGVRKGGGGGLGGACGASTLTKSSARLRSVRMLPTTAGKEVMRAIAKKVDATAMGLGLFRVVAG